MKSTKHQIAISLRQEVLKSKATHFVCTQCLQEKKQADKATKEGICKTCRTRIRREEYKALKHGKLCKKCGVVSTNFTGANNICRDCRNKDRKGRNMKFRKHLGEKLLILWKAGYSFDSAMETIRFANKKGL